MRKRKHWEKRERTSKRQEPQIKAQSKGKEPIPNPTHILAFSSHVWTVDEKGKFQVGKRRSPPLISSIKDVSNKERGRGVAKFIHTCGCSQLPHANKERAHTFFGRTATLCLLLLPYIEAFSSHFSSLRFAKKRCCNLL